MNLLPAYGRDYTSKAAIQADFDAGKDFILSDFFSPWDGKPCNKESLQQAGITQVNIRYKAKTKVAVLEVNR
jgi:hypothetical protein